MELIDLTQCFVITPSAFPKTPTPTSDQRSRSTARVASTARTELILALGVGREDVCLWPAASSGDRWEADVEESGSLARSGDPKQHRFTIEATGGSAEIPLGRQVQTSEPRFSWF